MCPGPFLNPGTSHFQNSARSRRKPDSPRKASEKELNTVALVYVAPAATVIQE